MTPTPEKFLRARITQRQDVSADLWAIGVDPGGEFRFTAGQYATLGVETPHKLIERPYSIVSSQYEREVEFFIELVPRGELSPLLYELRPGDPLFVRKTAKGRFTLDTTSGRTRHLLLCTVTGIAPFLSYVRTCTGTGRKRDSRASTSCSSSKAPAAPGSLVIAQRWNGSPQRFPG